MKKANIIEVRDVTPARLGNPEKRQSIEGLLRRWPETTEAETAEILHFLASGNHLDVGLLSGSDEFREKVQRFRTEYRRDLRPKAREVFLFLLVTVGPVAALFLRYLG